MDGFTSEVKQVSVNEFEIKNTKDGVSPQPVPTYDIAISKEVIGDVPSDRKFSFMLLSDIIIPSFHCVFTDANGNETENIGMIDENGEWEFALKNGESVTLYDLPEDFIFSVKELLPDGQTEFVPSYKVDYRGISQDQQETVNDGNSTPRLKAKDVERLVFVNECLDMGIFLPDTGGQPYVLFGGILFGCIMMICGIVRYQKSSTVHENRNDELVTAKVSHLGGYAKRILIISLSIVLTWSLMPCQAHAYFSMNTDAEFSPVFKIGYGISFHEEISENMKNITIKNSGVSSIYIRCIIISPMQCVPVVDIDERISCDSGTENMLIVTSDSPLSEGDKVEFSLRISNNLTDSINDIIVIGQYSNCLYDDSNNAFANWDNFAYEENETDQTGSDYFLKNLDNKVGNELSRNLNSSSTRDITLSDIAVSLVESRDGENYVVAGEDHSGPIEIETTIAKNMPLYLTDATKQYPIVLSIGNPGHMETATQVAIYAEYLKNDGSDCDDLNMRVPATDILRCSTEDVWIRRESASNQRRLIFLYKRFIPIKSNTEPIMESITLPYDFSTPIISANETYNIAEYMFDNIQLSIRIDVSVISTHDIVDHAYSRWGIKIEVDEENNIHIIDD